MPRAPVLTQAVESFRFWEVASLWADERLVHEVVLARVIATAVVQDGLRLNSVDLRWVKAASSSLLFDGSPYVGFRPNPSRQMMALRIEALDHLVAVVRRAETPSRSVLTREFILREDFRDWLEEKGQPLPSFWFPET